VSLLAGDVIECKEYGETRKTIKVGFDLRLQEIIDKISKQGHFPDHKTAAVSTGLSKMISKVISKTTFQWSKKIIWESSVFKVETRALAYFLTSTKSTNRRQTYDWLRFVVCLVMF